MSNLVINAVQSMSEGGIIRIEAENTVINGKNPVPVEKGKYVKISIKDQGTGIPRIHLEKIFKPYFTTKNRGKGLGLFNSLAIIKDHKGYITVESELNKGSTFHVYLPALNEVCDE